MGGLFSRKKSSNNQNDNNSNSQNKQAINNNNYQQPQKSRVNDTDKAILDIKARLRKLKTYIDKLNIDIDTQDQKIKEHLTQKSKQRALIALKHKKFLEQQHEKSMGAQVMLLQTIQNVESAQMDVNVFEAMKQGDSVLAELQSKASIEDFEEIYDKMKDHQEMQEKEREFFGQALNDEELEDELQKLDALILEEELPSAGTENLIIDQKSQQIYDSQSDQQQQQNNSQKIQQRQEPMLA
eukprot:403372921